MTQKTNQNPWTMDVRVRERNLKSGALTDKDLEKQLAALPDLADQSEPFGTSQPALAPPPAPPPQPQQHAAPVSDSDAGDADDDDDDVDDEEDDVAAPDADADGAAKGDSEGEQP